MLGSFLFSGDDANKPAGVLSGGEKTRLALAILVVSSANVLLLDEPTNNLDPASREEVLDAIRTYAGAIVLVTHDEGAVHALEPDRVLLLPDGVEDLWTATTPTWCRWPEPGGATVSGMTGMGPAWRHMRSDRSAANVTSSTRARSAGSSGSPAPTAG